MQYMLLIHWDQSGDADLSPVELEAQYDAYRTYTKQVRDRNLMLSGQALQPPEVTTTVRVKNGKVLITDGPFVETKEQLGGYYLLDCKDLDEAIEMAAKIPHAQKGTIEIRPVMHY